MRPARTPIGLQLTHAARVVGRAFDDALASAGGSLPVWLVLVSLTSQSLASQRELADVMGIREATLTHHLTAMESAGLITRRRDAANRRIQVVELTGAGAELFGRLRDVALAFDEQLRRGLSAADVSALEDLLCRLEANVGTAGPDLRPWAGLAAEGSGPA
jgi:MarR family transcriptional regulator, transcriptional regulator for hemolysin